MIDRHAATGRPDLGTGPLGLILNVVWFLVAGWWIALHHVIIGAAQFVTIIGIPFAWQHFKLAFIGEWSLGAFLIVAGAFATVHGNWWPTAIVWALLIGALLVYTKSLGACIIAHAVTNLLLAVYVLVYHDWSFW